MLETCEMEFEFSLLIELQHKTGSQEVKPSNLFLTEMMVTPEALKEK